MQTYHKHGMGETITLFFPITSNGAGVPGQSPVAAVRKKNGQWLNDAKTAWQAGYNDIAMAELDGTNLPGVYTLDITHIDLTSEEYQVFFKNTGTYPGIDFESHIFTGAVYVPPTSSYSTGTIGGLLNIAMNKDGNNTYSQATDSLEARADDTRLNNLDATISSRSTLTAQQVWEYGTRTLSSFGTLIADIWAYATRKLTSRNIGVGDDIASDAKIDTLLTESQSHPTLAEIEATTVLAKEATVNTRLASVGYTSPDNAGIAAIKAKTDTINWQDVTRLLGLTLDNHVEGDIVRDGSGNKTSSILYAYDSAANATTHDKVTGLIGKYNATFSYTAGKMSLGKIVRVV